VAALAPMPDDDLLNSPAPSAISLEDRLTLLERSLSVLTTALSARQGDGPNPPATPAGSSGSQPTPRSMVTPNNSGFSLPEPVLPRLAPPRIKPVRKFITEQGYFHTPLDTSKRSEKSEPQDMAKPWKTMHKALSEILVLLGPPPLPEDLAASTWYERILSAILVYQGEALFELAMVERKRSAPNLSVERAKAVISASWPDWNRIQSTLLEAQERAATAAALTRLPSLSHHHENPPPPAGRGGKRE
jgi:hypothetical protein